MSNKIKVNYYDDFRCTADKCPYTCCQEWIITIDEETRSKWDGVELHGKVLCDCIEKENDEYKMVLNEDKMCPFLNKNHLCGMVVDLGEQYLSKICMSYPRHISQYTDRQEYALDFGCPAVIDLVNKSTEGVSFVQEGEPQQSPSFLYKVREMIVEFMGHTKFSLTERMMMTYYCLLDLLEQETPEQKHLDTYQSMTYLEELVSEMRKVEQDKIESFWERNEFFLDNIQLYRREENYTSYLEEISVWAEKIEEYYADTTLEEKLEVFEKQYINYEKLMNNYLVSEMWANVLKADITLEQMVKVFEWIVLEYCTIKHAIFLKWLSEEEPALSYEMVRDYMMIISRTSSDDYREIEEYLALSFEETILEWGHLALILGNSDI